jgi:hypothetical protein
MKLITYKYVSPTYKNCSPSGAQQQALSTDQTWGKTLTANYGQVFQDGSYLFNNLSGKLDSIINNPQGYSAPELSMMNSETLNTAAANAKKASAAIGERAAVSGATPGVESGVVQAERAGADTSILNNMSNQQAKITEDSAALAQQRQTEAIAQEEALPGAAFGASNAAAGAVTGANAQTAAQANQNAATSDQWVGVLGGIADSAVAGLTGNIGARMFTKNNSSQSSQPGPTSGQDSTSGGPGTPSA